MARDTTTGSDYEAIIRTCIDRSCRKNSMTARTQIVIGNKPGGGKHRIDWELTSENDPNLRGLVSCKFQKTSGTAEEKIAYETIKLLHAMEVDPRYSHSWIIMGGMGWSPGIRRFTKSELSKWIPKMAGKITFLTTDELVSTEIKLEENN